jgi:hypothetical protein
VVGKDMPSLEVRVGRGGHPPLYPRDRELGRDGSPGAISYQAPSVRAGGAFFNCSGGVPAAVGGSRRPGAILCRQIAMGTSRSTSPALAHARFGICGRGFRRIEIPHTNDGTTGT